MKYKGLMERVEQINVGLTNSIYISEQGDSLLLVTCRLVLDIDKLKDVYLTGYVLEQRKSGHFKKELLMQAHGVYEKDGIPKSLWVQDIKVIEPEQRSKGYGSILMEQFLECAQTLNIRSISGSFSSTDDTDANRDRRRRVYEKYGFVVTGSKVYLDLKK